MAYNYEGSTHTPILIKVLQNTEGSVLELGSGMFSTPLLHWLCEEAQRPLVTYEAMDSWYEDALKFESETHKVIKSPGWKDMDLKSKKWGVAFIDHGMVERCRDIRIVQDNADVIVIHDTEDEAYGYAGIWELFPHIYHWKFRSPWTSVVSKFNDLSFLR